MSRSVSRLVRLVRTPVSAGTGAARAAPRLMPGSAGFVRGGVSARGGLLAPVAPLARFASTSASMSSSPSSLPPIPSDAKVRVTPPSLDAVREEGFLDEADIKLVPEDEASLVITPEAIRQLSVLASGEPPDSTLALRVGVDSGGCHGYQYIMELTEDRGADDYVMQVEGAAAIPVLVDLMSLGMLKGATLHYATELIGSSFRLQDNPQAKEGGNCGCGVSWEAKDQ